MGNFTISDSVFRQIAEYQANQTAEIYKVLKIRVQNQGEGTSIYMEVTLVYGYNVLESIKDFKRKIINEIENLTAMNVINLEVVAKNIVVLEENVEK